MATTQEDILTLINNCMESTIKEKKSCSKDITEAHARGTMIEVSSGIGRMSGLDYCMSTLQTMKYIVKNHWKE